MWKLRNAMNCVCLQEEVHYGDTLEPSQLLCNAEMSPQNARFAWSYKVSFAVQLEACRFLSRNQLMLFYNHIALDWLWSLLLLFVYRIACGRGHMRCPYISPINVLLWKSYWTCHCIVLVHKIYTQVPFSTHRTDNFKRTLIIWQLNVITAGNRGRCTTSNLNMNINPPVSDVNISTSAEQWTTSCTAQTCINRNLLQIYVSLF